ncbi:MAG: translocation/assembly module TamB domain-containing protein [Gammaproteobacteria bacterium]
MSRNKTIWLGVAGIIVLIPAILAVVLWFLVSTESGTRWLFDRGMHIVAQQGIHLRYAAMRGTLVDRLEVDGLDIRIDGEQAREDATSEFSLNAFVFQWQPKRIFQGIVTIDLLKLDQLMVNLPASAESASSPVPEIPDLILPFEIELKRLEVSNVYLGTEETPAIVDKLVMQVLMNRDAISINDIRFSSQQASVAGEIKSAVSAPHQLQGKLDIAANLPDQVKATSHVNIGGQILKPVISADVDLPFKMKLLANIDISEKLPAFDLQASWPAVHWPLQGDVQLESSDGKFTAQGSVDNYQLQLHTELRGPQLPESDVSLSASGDTGKLVFQEILLKTLEGKILMQGNLAFAPALNWNFSVVSESINPGIIDPQLQGRLNGQFSIDGQLQGENITGKLSIAAITGQLRDYPFELTGELEYLNNRLGAQDVKLNIGDNHLMITGSMGELMNLDVDIQAPKLEQLYPQLSGSISGNAKLAGKPDLPDITLKMDALDIVFLDTEMGQLVFNGDWNQRQGSVELLGKNIIFAGETVDQLYAKLSGEFANHQLTINLKSPDKSLSLALDGSLAEGFGSWKARINQFAPALQSFKWQLKAPSELLLSSQQYQLKNFCLSGETEEICIDGDWHASQQQLKADMLLSNYDLNQLKPMLPEGLQITGLVSGKMHAEGDLDNIRANASLAPSDGVIHFKNEAEEINVAYRDVVIKAAFENDEASVKLNFLLGENGQGNGKFKIGKSPKRKLDGNINASLPDLRIVQGFLPQLNAFNGLLNMNMQLTGQLDEPVINGKLKLSDAKANIPAAGIELKDINVVMESDNSRQLKIQAQLKSGEGYLKANGFIDPSTFPAKLELAIQGDKFQVARLPEAIVEISPDLKLEGGESPKLSGRLLIPTAKIEIQQVPESAVKVSADEVIVGEPVRENKANKITATVNLVLGEDVSFKGFGLETGLTGNIEADYDGKTSKLYGKIEMQDGGYSAFGQSLAIEKGRFIFAGPTDNPGIDLKAKRVSLDKTVTAYLAVTGQASSPSIRVYSDPSLPEAEALSYLVTGRPMNQARGNSGDEISAAALSLGLTKAMPALARIQEDTGLDDFRIDSGSGGIEDTSLMMGKYLNPDLYIGYVHGLFDGQGGVKVNYRLTDRIEVESFSGEQDSVDIYYRYEHD